MEKIKNFKDFISENKFILTDEILEDKFNTLSLKHFKFKINNQKLIDTNIEVKIDTDLIKGNEHKYNLINGWYIKSVVCQSNFYYFIDAFKAFHPLYGWVYKKESDSEYLATSEETFEKFIRMFGFESE